MEAKLQEYLNSNPDVKQSSHDEEITSRVDIKGKGKA